MSETHTAKEENEKTADGKPGPKIHRVCIGCNNMFEVTMDHFEAKHCPACHKG